MRFLHTNIALCLLFAVMSVFSCKRADSPRTNPLPPVPTTDSNPWQNLTDGIDFGRFPVPGNSNKELWIVRIDVKIRPLQSLSSSQLGHGNLTADQWAEKHNLCIVINAGMFETDHKSHVGYWKSQGNILRDQIRKDYSSIAAFGPLDPKAPAFHIFDRDQTDWEKDIAPAYQNVVQNLRLIKRPGENRWPQQEKAWSEAALGEDAAGRALLIFCPVGLTMHDFNNHLLKLPIDLVAAQHLEGGPEASLYLKIGDWEIRGIGSYETGFNENDDNKRFWPLPNVIAVSAVKPGS